MPTLLTDGRICIREPALSDASELFAAVHESLDELTLWLPWCHAGYQQQETEQYLTRSVDEWARREEFSFLICDAGTQEIVGGVGVSQVNTVNRLASMGYWVRTSHTRRGVAKAAARLAARFAFEEADLVRLEIVIKPENLASRCVAEAVGAKFECIARNRIVMHGKAFDAALYSLIPSDLRAG